jgi:UDPglucose--hexose-1-phosphate uridylyltransferase
VVIESPRHLRSLTELTDAEVALVFRAYRDRTRDMERDKQVAYALAFKNVGPAAGASLEHIHSQIVGLPLVPPVMHEELQGAAKFFAIQRDCVFCHLIQQELLARRRIVVRVEQFVAICPYASRFPYEVWVLPERHSASFQHSPDAQLAVLARTARCILSALERGCGITAYNFLIHSSPFDIDCQDHYHWHMEIIPRTVKAAGFEWGTGMQINPVLPEEAADQLRNAIA